MRHLVFALALLVPSSAHAQVSDTDRSTARALAKQGQEALDKRDYATAADRFTRAGELVHAPTLELGLARAQVGLGRWIVAVERYNRVIREPLPAGAPPAFAKALADAKAELAELEPRIPSVTIVVKNAPAARVTLDGAPVPAAAVGVPRPVDPGKHTIRVEADGFAPVQTAFTAVERKTETVTLTLEPAPAGAPVAPSPPPPAGATPPAPPPPHPPAGAGNPPAGEPPKRPVEPPPPPVSTVQRSIGIAGIAVGGAGIVLGAVTGGLAIPKHSSLAMTCTNGICPSSQASDLSSYHVLTTLSTAGLIAGGVLATAGVVLVVTAPKPTARTGVAVAPVLGAGYVGAKGWF